MGRQWLWLWYSLLGYGCGSLLFAYLIPKYLLHLDVTQRPGDHNPGTFNVFAQAGAGMGLLVLFLELGKGFFPVWAALRRIPPNHWGIALVIAAPVLGHAFPFWKIRGGGKAIAVSFGVLLGLYPDWRALGFLIAAYLFFSRVVVITPHLHRSLVTYGCVSLLSVLLIPQRPIAAGVVLVSIVVIVRHLMQDQGEKISVHLGLRGKENTGNLPEKRGRI